jgi:P-type Ca2+ transporter type 2C
MNFSEKEFKEVIDFLKSDDSGLSNDEAENRLNQYGPNQLKDVSVRPWWILLLKQFKNFLVYILLIAAFISYITAHYLDVYVILAVVLINAIIGFVQEMKAERAIASLKNMVVPKARVLRNGEATLIDSKFIVPGDIIILEEGDAIPADARIIEAKNLRCVEASLTGESVPVNKDANALLGAASLGDKRNMTWKGTFVVAGYARAVVTTTGMQTALGSIAASLDDIKEVKTNFQQKADQLGKQMGIIALASASLLFLLGYLTHDYAIEELMLISIAALVSSIPEGLPAVLSIVLAIGANHMSKKNAIIREFTSTETLGAVTTIITDKTGTLTQNALTLRKILVNLVDEIKISGEGWKPLGEFSLNGTVIEADAHQQLNKFLTIAALSNNASIKHNQENDTYQLLGDPTEGALLVASKKAGLKVSLNECKKLDDIPFNSENKYRASLICNNNGNEIFVIGAPEKLLELSSKVLTNRGIGEFTINEKENIRQSIEAWSESAMRVIALAYKPVKDDTFHENEINELVFVGICGMIDPPRPEVYDAVLKCKEAGIRVIMATGDHIKTAIAIAKASGILDENSKEPQALTQHQLEALDEREWIDAISSINVFARLSPAMKLRIAESLQNQGELIAMTGDGVNDAPALKRADVGIAMGIMGTDVARDASKVVLADDNFATIVNAIEEGRIVFRNAKQTSFFLITTNFAEISTLIITILFGLPIPLTATQLLWLNLVTDGIGDISLATERGHGEVLKQKPVKKNSGILSKEILPFLFLNAGVMTILSILVFKHYLPVSTEKARTMVFIVMAFTQLFNIYNMRSLKYSVFKIGFFSNKYINLAIVVSVIIQVMLIEIPFFELLFGFEFVSALEFITMIVLSSMVLIFGEIYKFIKSRIIQV